MTTKQETIRSRIWEESAEADNPFAAAACYCSGFDVYGDLLGKASWAEYLYLLFRQEPPSPSEAKLLEGLAVAIANPGPRDHSIRAAMCAGVGGSSGASALMAALAVGAGQYGGAREVRLAMEGWEQCGEDFEAWCNYLTNPPCNERIDVWPEMEHPPGFDPNGVSCPTPVLQTLDHLTQQSPSNSLKWLQKQRLILEQEIGIPLAMTGVAAATLADLGFTPPQGEMLYLLLRLPGAAAHALEQWEYGFRHYPFFAKGLEVTNDPGPYKINKG
ncbi:citryl-CoA lyase [Pseudomonadota bacterium]